MRAITLRLRKFEDLLLRFGLGGGLFLCADFRVFARIPLPTPFGGHLPPGGRNWLRLYWAFFDNLRRPAAKMQQALCAYQKRAVIARRAQPDVAIRIPKMLPFWSKCVQNPEVLGNGLPEGELPEGQEKPPWGAGLRPSQ